MTEPAFPLQIAAISAAVLWPLALGVSLVVWSKLRAAERRRKLIALEGGLRGLFRTVAAQPVPDRLEIVVETLEDHIGVASQAEDVVIATRLKPATTS